MQRWQSYADAQHQQLLAAEPVVQGIVATVSSDSADWALTVTGEGGIGKTAVTYQAAKLLSESGQFDRVIWASAKDAAAVRTEDGHDPKPVLIDWQDVLEKIAEQLDVDFGPRTLASRGVKQRVEQLTRRERLLLVVDNLEDVNDAGQVIDRVRELGLGKPHRLVAVSRKALTSSSMAHVGVRNVRVPPLDLADTLRLVRLAGHDDADLRSADDSILAPIYGISEGNPYLIKLIVSIYLRTLQPLDTVINDLKSNQAKTGQDVRWHLYGVALLDLEERYGQEVAHRLMASFALSVRGARLTFEDIMAASRIADADLLHELIAAAGSLFLVNSSDLHQRYSIHSLLHEYLATP
jgi:hypothetical protein